jgi:hypothetical protein
MSKLSPSLLASQQPAQTTPKILYDRKSAAYALSVSVRTLDYLIAGKHLTFTKLGSKVMLGHTELMRFSKMNHFSIGQVTA